MNLASGPGIIDHVRIRLADANPLHDLAVGLVPCGRTKVILDATDMMFASPLDLAGIAAWGARLRCEGHEVAFAVPDDDHVCRYLVRMDLVDQLANAGIAITGPVLPVRRADCADVLREVRSICGPTDVERFNSDVYELLELHTSASSAAAATKMLGELLDNAITHASSPVGVYSAAQVHRRSGDVELAVADAGIGVRAHLARHPCFRHLAPAQALDAALKPGVTGTSEQRGNGLPDLLRIASGYGGQLLLRSETGYVLVNATSPARRVSVAGHVPGTWAWVHVRLPSSNAAWLHCSNDEAE